MPPLGDGRVRDENNRLVIGAGNPIPLMVETRERENLKDSDRVVVVSSATSYAKIAGRLVECYESQCGHKASGKRDARSRAQSLEKCDLHLRIVSDHVQFPFTAKHMLAIAREQKIFKSFTQIPKSPNTSTSLRVASEIAHTLGRYRNARSVMTHVVYLGEVSGEDKTYFDFLQQFVEEEPSIRLLFMDSESYAVRHPAKMETEDEMKMSPHDNKSSATNLSAIRSHDNDRAADTMNSYGSRASTSDSAVVAVSIMPHDMMQKINIFTKYEPEHSDAFLVAKTNGVCVVEECE